VAGLCQRRLGWSRCRANSVHGTPVRANSSDFVDGWTIGGGAEFAICSRLSLGVEYDYANLDKDYWKISCPTCPSGVGGGVPVLRATSSCNL
jgi:opacity protein-like surface antigen